MTSAFSADRVVLLALMPLGTAAYAMRNSLRRAGWLDRWRAFLEAMRSDRADHAR